MGFERPTQPIEDRDGRLVAEVFPQAWFNSG